MGAVTRFKEEDMVILAFWLRRVLDTHCGGACVWIDVGQHVRVGGHEVDLLIKCQDTGCMGHPEGRQKSIIVELKESDLGKVFEQALERRPLADYVYAAINLPVNDILTWMAGHDLAEEAVKAGVGIISTRDNVVIFRAYSRGASRWAETKAKTLTLLKYIPAGVENSG